MKFRQVKGNESGGRFMNLIPWKTKNQEEAGGRQLAPATGLRSEVDRLFDSFFREPWNWGGDRSWRSMGALDPVLDVEETDKDVCIRAEIPGINPDDLELSISGNSLVLSGEKKESIERPEKGYFYQERRYGAFRREVPLPSAVDANDVQAEYKDGVLEVRLKKSEEALPKRIPVKASK